MNHDPRMLQMVHNVRLDGNDGSVTKEFFEEGNAAQLAYYGSEGKFPWLKA
jgi:hypothetical protein